jgi:RND superfamily putative drug exporter
MLGRVAHLPGVEAVASPYSTVGAAQVSPSGNTAYATVTLVAEREVMESRRR